MHLKTHCTGVGEKPFYNAFCECTNFLWFSYWDYRDVGGVRLPHVTIRSVGDLGPPHGLVLESVEINVELPDSLFLPPGER